MQLLVPDLDVEPDLDALYAHPASLVRGNMVASLDGAVRDQSGLSGGLSSATDKRIFGTLRAACDVVLVGAGTARAEGYGPARMNDERRSQRAERGQSPTPVIAVVSRSLDLDLDARLFADAQVRTVVLTVESSDQKARRRVAEVADVLVAGADSVDAGLAVDQLSERGLSRVLCEGGPHLLGDLAAAGRLDELCLSIALRLVGGDSGRMLAGAAIDGWFGEPSHVLSDDEHLFLRIARSTTPNR